MADKPVPIPDHVITDFLLLLRADRLRKLEFTSAVTEGVVLAVEQVQEIRIASLEAGPDRNASDIVVDVFWGFLFDSGINILWSRVLMGGFLRSMEKLTIAIAEIETRRFRKAAGEVRKAKELVQMRQILYRSFNSHSSTDGAKLSASELGKAMDALERLAVFDAAGVRKGTVDLRKLINARVDEGMASSSVVGKLHTRAARMGLSSLALREIRVRLDGPDSDAKSAAAVMVEQLLANTRNYLSDSSPVSAGSPSTDLLAGTYAWASRQRQQIHLLFDRLEVALLQSGQMEDGAAVCLLLGATSDAPPDDLVELRSRAWLLCEAVIWAETYLPRLLGTEGIELSISENLLETYKVPGKIADYLTERFDDVARKWIASPSADSVLARYAPPPPGPSVRATPTANQSAAENVLRHAVQALQRARDSMRTEHTAPRALPVTQAIHQARLRKRATSSAVRAFLLSMLYLYRINAGAFLEALQTTKAELESE